MNVTLNRRTLLAWAALAGGTAGLARAAEPLAAYRPDTPVDGPLRLFGSDLAGLVELWEKDFRRFHPKATFENRFPTSDGAVGGLISGAADIGTSGREMVLTEFLMFNETTGHDPLQVPVATGAFDRKGRTWAPVIYVHRSNPIASLSMEQLDGIFGASRSGGYAGMKWMPEYGRGADRDLRTWGQLGLTGAWANRPIQTYGYALTGMSNYFQIRVFQGGDKWNPNYRQYVEDGTKMVGDGALGPNGTIGHMLREELAHDEAGIAWAGIPHGAGIEGLKVLPIAPRAGAAPVVPTRTSVQDHSYPLARSIFFILDKKPDTGLSAASREFVRYVLSREGQAVVQAHGDYLPLTEELAKVARESLG